MVANSSAITGKGDVEISTVGFGSLFSFGFGSLFSFRFGSLFSLGFGSFFGFGFGDFFSFGFKRFFNLVPPRVLAALLRIFAADPFLDVLPDFLRDLDSDLVAISVTSSVVTKDVDGRDEPGHDDS